MHHTERSISGFSSSPMLNLTLRKLAPDRDPIAFAQTLSAQNNANWHPCRSSVARNER
jgi:hypothetical protein